MDRIETEDIFSSIVSNEGRASGFWKGLRLESFYQPIFGIPQKRTIGFEALARGYEADGTLVYPGKLFSMAKNEADLVFLDRLLRAIHILNFQNYRDSPYWLFLNVDPTVAIYGRKYGPYFEELLHRTGFRGDQLVIEIVENTISSNNNLEVAAEYYRSHKSLVAVDDFGAGHSNFDRIWSIKPEIVKLDRTILVQASKSSDIRRILPELVSLVRASGSLCLIEGIETPDECLLALETDIDFVQGFYFAKPEKNPLPPPLLDFSNILSKSRALIVRAREPIEVRSLMASFEEITRYSPHEDIFSLLGALFTHYPSVSRYFVLDQYGCQIGNNWERNIPTIPDNRFLPLMNTKNADWSHRAYFREAVHHVGTSYISSPYLSTTGAHICRTMSMAVEKDGEIYVYCIDIEWNTVAERDSWKPTPPSPSLTDPFART